MQVRDFYSYSEASAQFGVDAETFRQLLLRGRGPKAYVEMDRWDARWAGSRQQEPCGGSNEHAEWRLDAYPLDGGVNRWVLRGWFQVMPSTLRDALRHRGFTEEGRQPYVEVMPWGLPEPHQDHPAGDNFNSFVIDGDEAPAIIPQLDALWFEVDEVALMVDANATAANQEESISTRKYTNMLRVIRALQVMAGVPDRGAASSIERQLEGLGFDSPKEKTIRELLKEASELRP